MKAGTITTAILALFITLGATWFASSADAKIEPMSKSGLTSEADLIIDGAVLSSRFLAIETNGPRQTTRFSSVVRVDQVEKGNVKKGDVITIYWFTKKWVGSQPEPPSGHTLYPVLSPCERFNAYLRVDTSKKGAAAGFSFVHYNAKTCQMFSPSEHKDKINCYGGTVPSKASPVKKCAKL